MDATISPRVMAKVNIVCRESNFGLAKCTQIVSELASQSGHTVSISSPKYDGNLKIYLENLYRLATLRQSVELQKAEYDINLFIEDIDPNYFPRAKRNYLIPNQEWFRYRWLPYLIGLDGLLTKTRFSQRIFSFLKCRTNFVGFTSEDRFEPCLRKDYNSFFHLAGNSPCKGTEAIVKLWLQHPEWPLLTIVQNRQKLGSLAAKNIRYHIGYIDDQQLKHYQNTFGIHLCPSETEGFGHYIAEAMSCKALVITTNAPPMNELVTPERGILVDYYGAKFQCLSKRYYVDLIALERCINQVITLASGQKQLLGEQARQWYLENDNHFKNRFCEALVNLGLPLKPTVLNQGKIIKPEQPLIL